MNISSIIKCISAVMLLGVVLTGCGRPVATITGSPAGSVASSSSGEDVSSNDAGSGNPESSSLLSSDMQSSENSSGPQSSEQSSIISTITSILSSSLSSHSSSATSSQSAVDITEAPEPTEYVQPHFYISSWRAVHYNAEHEKYTKIIKATKEAGITLVENAILGRADGLMSAQVCEEQGMDFFISNITDDLGYTGMFDKYPAVDEDRVEFIVDEMKDYKHLKGYYVWDEVPDTLFGTCRTIKDWFIKHDPAKLAFSLVVPSYGEYRWNITYGNVEESQYYKFVDSYIKEVDPDVLSFDYYVFRTSHTLSLTKSDMWKDMGLFRTKSIETGKPFWFYFQGFDMETNTVGRMTREKLAVQMFSAVAYGAKTVSYFQSVGTLTDEFGNKTSLYEGAKSLNREVQNVGDLLFDMEPRYLYHIGLSSGFNSLYFMDEITESPIIASAPDNTIVSIFNDGTKSDYIVIVNKDYVNPKTGKLVLQSAKHVEAFDKVNNKFTEVSSSTTTVNLTIKPGDCVVYRIG
ncbi:MAG: hypothetical protein ACYCYM_01380 [Saccharofermentanales bacterium]